MSEEAKLGSIEMIDLENRFGIITEASTGETVTFDIDDTMQELRQGQLVQFFQINSNIGPRATHITILKK